MQKSIHVVEAAESDLAAIVSLLHELNDVRSNQQDLDIRAVTGNLTTLLHSPRSHLLVAKDGETITGFINIMVRHTALHTGMSGLIDELVVAGSHRGQGIGKVLVSAAIDKCRWLGCCEIEVSTEKTNTAAREFYRQCGFQEGAVLLEMQLKAESAT